MPMSKTVLILGANSDVAKAALLRYVKLGHHVIAASRSTAELEAFIAANQLPAEQLEVSYFDAVDFDSHSAFYAQLSKKPHIVVYAAGFLVQNEQAFTDWKGTKRMMDVHYAGAVSMFHLLITDLQNSNLERIIGLSSLSGVRGRKSNFVYGSTKAAFTQYLAGLRQELASRNIVVNVIVAGYIDSKMTQGLDLPKSLLLTPDFIAQRIVNAPRRFTIVPGFKWKMIYLILKWSPGWLVAKLP
jgi:decaprenylphospho-beta-D-erythro-pentofuranosid-2-ulose 2-reductase